MSLYLIIAAAFAVLAVIAFFTAVTFRRVVPTNEAHIVQNGKKTISYGSGSENGNTYYEWPTSLPLVGVTRSILPISVFDMNLTAYEAYDIGRVPFVVDVVAFFRIFDTNVAASRISTYQELLDQLKFIMQGAVRSILASNEIENIMQSRATFGEAFTKEVAEQLKHWGVEPVKNMELMDIRDSKDTNVIKNIMKKKESKIDMESRTAVAANQQAANIAEISAQRETELQKQLAQETVGLRTAQKTEKVGIADEQAKQNVQEQAKNTAEKTMAVKLVNDVRQAEITSKVTVVKADQDKQVQILNAEGDKQRLILVADGQLETQKRNAEGVRVNGEAAASAEQLKQVASVAGQVTLAKEIGENEGYQNYLVTVRRVEADEHIGIANAQALQAANIKVIANSGTPGEGIKNVGEMFSSKGGQALASMLEGLSQTEHGEKLVNKFLPGSDKPSNTPKPTATK